VKKKEKKICQLLSFFNETGLVSQDSIIQGFKLCYQSLSDIQLDVPNAPSILKELVQIAKSEGWLSSNFSEPKS
jgi:hypothetical protein